MPGLLGYNNNSAPGLLGNMGQALQSYATRTEPGGYMNDQVSRQELEEYEQAKTQGFTGTFDEWRQQKRARQTVYQGQNGFQALGRAMMSRGMGGY